MLLPLPHDEHDVLAEGGGAVEVGDDRDGQRDLAGPRHRALLVLDDVADRLELPTEVGPGGGVGEGAVVARELPGALVGDRDAHAVEPDGRAGGELGQLEPHGAVGREVAGQVDGRGGPGGAVGPDLLEL